MVLTEPQAVVPRRPTRRLLGIAAVLAGLCCAVAVIALLTHRARTPRILNDRTDTYAVASVGVGQSLYSDAGISPGNVANSAVLEISHVSVLTDTNTADATIALVVCPVAGTRVGADRGQPGRCAEHPLTPGRLVLSPSVQVVYAITPHQPGEVVVTGVDITYRVGSRAARHQLVGIGARLHADTSDAG